MVTTDGCPIHIHVIGVPIFILVLVMTHFTIGAGTGILHGILIILIMVITGLHILMAGDITAGLIKGIMLMTQALLQEETGTLVPAEEVNLIITEMIIIPGVSTGEDSKPHQKNILLV